MQMNVPRSHTQRNMVNETSVVESKPESVLQSLILLKLKTQKVEKDRLGANIPKPSNLTEYSPSHLYDSKHHEQLTNDLLANKSTPDSYNELKTKRKHITLR